MKGEGYLNRIYGETGRELRSMLLNIDLPTFTDEKAEMIRDKTRRCVMMLNLGVQRWLKKELTDAYRFQAKKARIALEILGKKPKHLPIDEETRLVDSTLELLVQRNSTIRTTVDNYLNISLLAAGKLRTTQIQEFSYQEAANILDELAYEAVLEQRSRGWLAKMIADYLRALLEVDEFININGKMWRMSKYSKMVARTTLKKARTKATLDLCKQYDNDLVQVSKHGTICKKCKPLEKGEGVFSLSGKSMKYPPLPVDVPAHPNCQHSIAPTSEWAIEARKKYKVTSVKEKFEQWEREQGRYA